MCCRAEDGDDDTHGVLLRHYAGLRAPARGRCRGARRRNGDGGGHRQVLPGPDTEVATFSTFNQSAKKHSTLRIEST